MFTKLFLQTTNPNLSWSQFFSINILFMILISVIFHTILYTGFINIVNYIFTNKILNKKINCRLIFFLMLIMIFGYIGRFFHVKQIYNDMNRNDLQTKEYINTHYNSWIFLG
jgi:hypothetical protein